jgi:hypothetical protein
LAAKSLMSIMALIVPVIVQMKPYGVHRSRDEARFGMAAVPGWLVG